MQVALKAATILKSAVTVHLILLCYLGDAIRFAVSADLIMVARNRPLQLIFKIGRQHLRRQYQCDTEHYRFGTSKCGGTRSKTI